VLFEKALFQFLQFFIPQSTTQGPSVQFFLLFFFNWSSKNEIIFLAHRKRNLQVREGRDEGRLNVSCLFLGGFFHVFFADFFWF